MCGFRKAAPISCPFYGLSILRFSKVLPPLVRLPAAGYPASVFALAPAPKSAAAVLQEIAAAADKGNTAPIDFYDPAKARMRVVQFLAPSKTSFDKSPARSIPPLNIAVFCVTLRAGLRDPQRQRLRPPLRGFGVRPGKWYHSALLAKIAPGQMTACGFNIFQHPMLGFDGFQFEVL